MHKYIKVAIPVLILVIGISATGISAQEKEKEPASLSAPRDELYNQIELFSDAISLIRRDYVDDVKSKNLIYGALKGMLASLDPHSQFMDPDTYNEVKIETEGEFGGIGIEITIKDELLTIITPIVDTPADKAGLKAQDRIVKIDGELTRGITLLEAVKKLRGKPGTEVKLMILRESEGRLLDFTITRALIKIESIKDARILEENIGYIRLVEFQEGTAGELEKALLDLELKGIDSLILDLRNNPGGLLNVAVEVADKFLPEGKMIVYTKGRKEDQNLEFRAQNGGTHPNYPLVLLINDGSASASEIVAGAIKDNKRGILVGLKTFGKGSVQTVEPLRDGSALRLTTSKYFTPSGVCIHGTGITPDVAVPEKKGEPREEGARPVDIFDKLKLEMEKKEPQGKETKAYDEQLERAIDLIRGIKVYRTFNGLK